ncbi:PREDICTED: SET and MYND domain-containing protein 4-like [Polistes dominula]|uniref:Protein-lysine N-methyltransferase SMYD4 n=1 Tax=Polistes dominula TaxID=743375 RepID=A0ABM1J499_POLDO|nr:PREDICTED: SET and MYND domain-containing protein 4-like [Polistes dominula]
MAYNFDYEISDYFVSNLFAVRNAISQQDFKKFTNLRSNADRVAFILSYPEAHHLSFEVENYEIKDGVKAMSYKNVGNNYFGSEDYGEALDAYSKAVLLAPQKDLPVMLANRSAALYHLQKYEHALEDIEEAIRLNYPKELRYKVEERRARCFLALKNNAKAIQCFRLALQLLDDAKLSSERKKKLGTDIMLMLSLMEKGQQLKEKSKIVPQQSMANETNEHKIMRKIIKRNPLYPACSKLVEIKNDDDNDIGRHAVAKKKILPGEILIIERPHCALLLDEYRLNHCFFCFSKMIVPIPAACNVCSCVSYCSTRCRDKDAQLHIRECSLLPVLWLSQASITCILALRTLLQRPFKEFLEMRERLTTTKEKREISEKKPYNGNDYESFHDLVTHEDQRTSEDIFHRAYIAAWLLRLVKTTKYLPNNDKTPDSSEVKLSDAELFVGELLLHHLQLLQFNSHEISELNNRKVKSIKKSLENATNLFIGGGVYPTVALLNHSCNPGVVRYFIGTTIVVRAIRTIEEGEEISENYGPIFTTMPEGVRKRNLRVQYWFDCKCEACTGHWPLLEQIDPTIFRFKCDSGKSCGNVLPISTSTDEFMINCRKCGKNTNILKGLKALQDTDMLFKVASRHLEDGRHNEALETYLKILKLLDETLSLPIRDYHLCQQGARLCMLTLGNTDLKLGIKK